MEFKLPMPKELFRSYQVHPFYVPILKTDRESCIFVKGGAKLLKIPKISTRSHGVQTSLA